MSEQNYKEFWNYAMQKISDDYKKNGNLNQFKLWFKINYLYDNENTITVSVPSEFMWNSMESKGNIKTIIETLKSLTGQSDIELNHIVIENESEINNENISISEIKTDVKKKEKKTIKNNTLEEKFTFENFIPSESTQFAYNVCLASAQNPGTKSNPIFLYGGVGLGKTHLMQAIGNKIHEIFGDTKKICYVQTETLMNDYTSSLLNKNTTKFQQKYRKLNVLLLDDIQFLNGREGLQNELFYTFEALHKENSQMVFACDRSLREVQGLADRLVSRLGSGITLDLKTPNFETRKAIILKKLELKNKMLSEEIINLISQIIETNVRDLEAALNKVLSYMEFLDKTLTLEDVKDLLKEFYNIEGVGNISIENILKVVADNYQISVNDIKSKKRDKKVVEPRFIALYIARELTEYSFTELGREFGGRDHSSVMNGYNKIKERVTTDSTFKNKIDLLIKEIKQYKK